MRESSYQPIFGLLLLLAVCCSGCEALLQAQATRQERRKQELIDRIDVAQQQSHSWEEEKIHQLVNQHRAQVKLSPLSLRSEISGVARVHSQNMANGTVEFGHDGFQERATQIYKMIAFQKTAENVAMNNTPYPCRAAIQGWLRSRGHKQNIEGGYNLTGIGVAQSTGGGYYFTQIFLISR